MQNGSLKSTGRLPSHIFKIELFLMAGALETPFRIIFPNFVISHNVAETV